MLRPQPASREPPLGSRRPRCRAQERHRAVSRGDRAPATAPATAANPWRETRASWRRARKLLIRQPLDTLRRVESSALRRRESMACRRGEGIRQSAGRGHLAGAKPPPSVRSGCRHLSRRPEMSAVVQLPSVVDTQVETRPHTHSKHCMYRSNRGENQKTQMGGKALSVSRPTGTRQARPNPSITEQVTSRRNENPLRTAPSFISPAVGDGGLCNPSRFREGQQRHKVTAGDWPIRWRGCCRADEAAQTILGEFRGWVP